MNAFEEGKRAYLKGFSWTDNPYEKMSTNYCDWVDGWFYQRGSKW